MFFKKKKKEIKKISPELVNRIQQFIRDIQNPPKQESKNEYDNTVRYSREIQPRPDWNEDVEGELRYSRRSEDETHESLLLYAMLSGKEPTFTERLNYELQVKNMTAAECYNKAHIDRKLFSQISKNVNYKPKKSTAIALGLALEMHKNAFNVFLKSAGYALSDSDDFDLIIRYCVENSIFDVDDVNDILYTFNQPLLGSK